MCLIFRLWTLILLCNSWLFCHSSQKTQEQGRAVFIQSCSDRHRRLLLLFCHFWKFWPGETCCCNRRQRNSEMIRRTCSEKGWIKRHTVTMSENSPMCTSGHQSLLSNQSLLSKTFPVAAWVTTGSFRSRRWVTWWLSSDYSQASSDTIKTSVMK